MSPKRIVVHTDGGCRPNPGPGGWGAVIQSPDGVQELSGSEQHSTNNRMELTAALRALEAIPPGSDVEVVTDSSYLQQGISRWLPGWRQRGWVTATREPVKNQDLWIALDQAAGRHQLTWRWIRGHAGHGGNERAHQLAAAAIPRPPTPALAPPSDPEAIEAFLAVAWSGTRKLGAWGAVLRYRDHLRELSGRVDCASSNAAHIASAVFALEAIRTPRPTRVITVSDYLRDGASHWLPAWKSRRWQTRDGRTVANKEWWQRLERQLARLPLEWVVADGSALPAELGRARELARGALEP